MDVLQAMKSMAELPNILHAAQVLERNGLLANGETSAQVVKRYVEAHPEINDSLARAGAAP